MRLLFTALACLISFSIFAQEDCINPDDIVVETFMYAYSPSDVPIDLGQTITWINTGGTHDVNGVTNSITGEPFDNPESFSIPATSGSPDDIGCIGSYTFTVPGVYSYDCSIYGHALQGMTGTITVGTPGCNDMTACNYSLAADFNDGSCLYPEVGYDCDGNCLQDLDGDDICDACEEFVTLVIDCACEFFDPATYTVFFTDVDEEECLITEDCYCECMNDIDNDGVCDENEILGCNLIEACNYDSSATDNDGSCVFVGDSCDDGDPNTLGDVIQENCECAGTPHSAVDELEALSVLIYPNPASNNLTVDLGDLNGVNTTIKLYDSSSKLVFEKQSTSTLTIDVSGFAKGMYSLELSTDEQVLRSQVIID